MSTELIEEIREDVRREELIRIWKKYGNWFIAGALIVIAGTMTGVYWEHHQQQKKIAKAHQYEYALTLLQEEKKEEALDVLKEIAKGDDKGYALMSLFKQAQLDGQGAESLQAIADNKKYEPHWRELANLILVSHDLDTENVASAPGRLEPLINSNGPWRALAAELLALALLRTKEVQAAQNVLKNLIQDEAAGQGVRIRASALMSLIGQN